MYNNKGLSAIVATVLIILLVIAGVTLVWTPVRKLISNAAEESEANCLLANPQITKACMNGANLEITISNGAEGIIDGIQVIYGNTADNLNNTNSTTTTIGINEVKKITIVAAGTPTATKIAAIISGETCAAGSISTVATTCA
ncbi:MAG: hypothetical protein V1889_00355 [archaeon]